MMYMLSMVAWAVDASAEPVQLTPVGAVTHAPVSEQSGIVQSERWPGTYWVQNDSGNPAQLFAIDAKGAVVWPSYLDDRYRVGPAPKRSRPSDLPMWPGLTVEGASNIDWEDLALDGDTLYIADLGNNGNARRDLGVYALTEPNPREVSRARALAFFPVAYPKQRQFPAERWHYDCEAVFVHRGVLYALTKHRVAGESRVPERGTDLYRLDTRHVDTVNVLTHVDHLDDIGGWVTAADMSADGKMLAVLVYAPDSAVWLFEVPAVGDALLSAPSRAIPLDLKQIGQAEGLAWVDADTVRITNEQRQLFDLSVTAIAGDETPAE